MCTCVIICKDLILSQISQRDIEVWNERLGCNDDETHAQSMSKKIPGWVSRLGLGSVGLPPDK